MCFVKMPFHLCLIIVTVLSLESLSIFILSLIGIFDLTVVIGIFWAGYRVSLD